jgi:hypothetical protein
MRLFLTKLLLIFAVTMNTAWSDSGDQYALFKVGSMAVDKFNADDLLVVGGIYGIGLSPSFTIEGEVSIGLDGGDFEEGPNKGQFKIWTAAGYLVYRYVVNEKVYLKLKGGLVYENIETSNENATLEDIETGVGATAGLGLGFVFPLEKKPVMMEFELTMPDKKIIFLSVGATFPF